MSGQDPQQSAAPHSHSIRSVRPSPYTWTETPPAEPGFWWVKCRMPADHREASHVVEIRRGIYGELSVWFMGEIMYPGMGVLKDARWAGPIPEPAG
jgi:hypothetical protein